jgi:hypothetical protein
LLKREIKKATTFTIATKIFRNKFNQEVKDLYNENYKTLMKEIIEDTKKRKDIPCSWIRSIILLK